MAGGCGSYAGGGITGSLPLLACSQQPLLLLTNMQEPRARLQERPEEGVHTVTVLCGLKGDFWISGNNKGTAPCLT